MIKYDRYFPKEMKKVKLLNILFISGILLLCFSIFFYHLGEYTLRRWDEGRNATNALEMVKNGNPIVTYFEGNPDMWNVKPPLHIWTVAILFKIFGVSELTLRLPSAIAGTIIVLSIYIFGLKILENRWIGLLGSLIILSSMGFPDTHIGRTGDYDALLTLFTFSASIFTFLYLQKFQKKHLYLMFLFWTLAILTKSTAGILLIPGVLIFVFLDKKFLKLIKQSCFWKMLVISILIICSYYISREILNPGYLGAVWIGDFIGRYKNDFGSGGNDFWYYWDLMASFRFQKWVYFLPFSLFALFLTKKEVLRKFILYAFLLVFSYLIIISKSETKQFWYDAQLYPLASLLVATFIILMIKKIPFIFRIFPIVILCFYMQRYIRTNIAYIHRPDLDKTSMSCIKYGYLFRDTSINKDGFIGVDKDSSCSPFYFYMENNNLRTKKVDEISPGDKILTCDEVTLNEIKENNKIETVFNSQEGCVGVNILSN